MLRHEDCKNWDYDTHPNVRSVEDVCSRLTDELRSGAANHDSLLKDSRPFHKQMFEHVVPAACPYMAGNYRGALFPCLANYPIFFGAPPGRREGEKPFEVDKKMDWFSQELDAALEKHRGAVAKAKTQTDRAILFNRLIAAVAALLTSFYNIHPYANGNGHIGRLLVWVTLQAFGHPPKKLTVHKSPKGYYDLFDLYRANKKKPLELFLLQCVVG